MVKSIINGVSTYYAGRHYNLEVNGETLVAQKTYAFGSMTIAVRTEGVLKWVLADHLGSPSITANADGSFNSEIRYSAFGEVRYSSGTTPTDYQYTNQLNQPDIGLYYYVARFYDPVIAHFVQADTIVPNAGNPATYDRYAYVLNDPIRLNDPTGHTPSCNNTSTGCLSAWNSYGQWASRFYTSSSISTSSNSVVNAAINHSNTSNQSSIRSIPAVNYHVSDAVIIESSSNNIGSNYYNDYPSDPVLYTRNPWAYVPAIADVLVRTTENFAKGNTNLIERVNYSLDVTLIFDANSQLTSGEFVMGSMAITNNSSHRLVLNEVVFQSGSEKVGIQINDELLRGKPYLLILNDPDNAGNLTIKAPPTWQLEINMKVTCYDCLTLNGAATKWQFNQESQIP